MEGVQLLEEAIDTLDSESVVSLEDTQIGPRIAVLLRQRARLDAEIACTLGAFDGRGRSASTVPVPPRGG